MWDRKCNSLSFSSHFLSFSSEVLHLLDVHATRLLPSSFYLLWHGHEGADTKCNIQLSISSSLFLSGAGCYTLYRSLCLWDELEAIFLFSFFLTASNSCLETNGTNRTTGAWKRKGKRKWVRLSFFTQRLSAAHTLLSFVTMCRSDAVSNTLLISVLSDAVVHKLQE